MFQRIFPHYRESIFDVLNDRFIFTLVHSRDEGSIPQITKSYGILKPMINIKGLVYVFGLITLYKKRPDIIIQEFALSFVNLYISYIYCYFFKCKLVLWGHGYNRVKGFSQDNNIADKIREYIIKKSDAVVLYSDNVKEEMKERFCVDKFFVARNSIQSEEKEIQYTKMKLKGKDYYREKYTSRYDINLSFVARISPNKKVELLIGLAERIRYYSDLSLRIHVVGDGEKVCEFQKLVNEGGLGKYFIFYGAIYKESIVAEIIFLSDFIVMPAGLGLSVNHGFCYGIPIATLRNEHHGPEISFVHDSDNGFLCTDIDEMAKRIVDCINKYGCSRDLGVNARMYFSKYLGIEAMYSGFDNAIKYTLTT